MSYPSSSSNRSETNGETQETKGAERFPVVFLGALESLRLSVHLNHYDKNAPGTRRREYDSVLPI